MKKLLFLVAVAVTVTTGCVARTGFGIGSAPVGGHRGGGHVVDVDLRGPGEDEHWFTADDFLVSKTPYQHRRLWGLRVAKMTAIATDQTNTEARFLVASGEELWTAHYFRTRVAVPADLAVGALAFCNGRSYERSVAAPRSKQEARQGQWILAAITDTSDLYKGQITVGNASCEVGGVRVIVDDIRVSLE